MGNAVIETVVVATPKPKPIWKSKTFWFNIGSVCVMIGTEFANVTFVKSEYIIMIAGIGNIILRMLSTQPVTVVQEK